MRHAVEDIRFDGSGWLLCSCGDEVRSRRESALNEAFQQHRIACGEPRRNYFDYLGRADNEFARLQTDGKFETPSQRYYRVHRDEVCARQRDRHARRKAAAA